jgi:PhoPQ-activated pathogenicity-related protein
VIRTDRLALVTMFLSTAVIFAPQARGNLDAYVRQPDASYLWNQDDQKTSEAGTATFLSLTSQTWRGIPWKHRLQIYEPAQVTYPDAVLLFITGGSHDSRPGKDDIERGFLLAKLCGARVAVLPQVPNQPLLDGKTEDDLIAETFVRYLDTKDETWPLLFPMVKSAVKAMDAVQEYGRRENKPVARFVVTGASKRGWTTWLTGAVDKRVAAIVPMVIPTLNMRAQNKHQLEVWGKYSEQIEDYTRRGLTEKIDTPDGTKLWHMIDPYSYRDRLTMPKLLINGTNDRYWTLDSLNLFWDDLKGPKWVVYLPNAGHGLEEHRDYATHGIGAFFRSVISNRPVPELWWKDGRRHLDRRPYLSVTSSEKPKAVAFWSARSETRDFREVHWTASPPDFLEKTVENRWWSGLKLERPKSGFMAMFGDLTFDIDGVEYHLSSEIYQTDAAAPK